jgi:hypothetical protein
LNTHSVTASTEPSGSEMHLMKKIQTWATILLLGAGMTVRGGLYHEGPYTTGFADGGNIPDGNPNGWWDTRNVSDIPSGWTIANVTVTFTISGGWNGDLYGYLSHNGVLIPMLNRVGTGTGSEPTFTFGYGDSGFNNVTLADGASVSIHNYGGTGVPNGTYLPDSDGLTFAVTFGGLNPNGSWTLYFADLSGGGGQSQLTSWSLDITAVPEPANAALGCFAGVFLVVSLVRSRRMWKRIYHWRAVAARWVDED